MRRIRTMAVVVFGLAALLVPSRPAAAHTDVCFGTGSMLTSAGLLYPLIGPSSTVSFLFFLNTGGCFDSPSVTMSGVLSGWCGAATGFAVTNDGHYLRFDWLGDEWTMTPLDPSNGLGYHVVGGGSMQPDAFNGQSCFSGAWQFLTTGVWTSPFHPGPPPPENYPPSTSQVSPADGHAFGALETQQFVVQAADPEGDSYVGRVRVTNSAGTLVATYFTERAASGTPATARAVPPLPPGSYTWTADATDDLVPSDGFGDAAGPRAFSVAGESSGPFPSDDCNAGGTTLVDGFFGTTYVRLRTKQPTAGTTWVCYRGESGAVRHGGKVELSTGTTPTPGTPTTDANFAACSATGGNAVPGPHPTLSGSVGDPSDPSTYVPFATDVYASADAAWACVRVGSVGHRVVVPVPQSGTPPNIFLQQDAPASHVPVRPDNPGSVSGTCQDAATGTKAEHANVRTGAGAIWLGSWQESPTRVHVCVRSQGTTTTGGRLTLDTTGFPGVTPVLTTSTTDTSACTVRVVGIDSPTTVDLRRSNPAATTGQSFCMIVGGTGVRVTVGATGSPAAPVPTWAPDS